MSLGEVFMKRLLVMGVLTAAVHVAPAYAQPPVGMVLALEPLPGALSSAATDINDTNAIVGWSYSGTSPHAVRWATFDRPVDLGGVPGFTSSIASSVNNNGVIAGHSVVNSVTVATKWSGDTASQLAAPPDYTNCVATSINDSGAIAGHCYTDTQPRA